MKKRNTRKRRGKKGGAKKIHPNKPAFTPVYDMIMNPNSNLTVFTVSSLKGFMLKLDVGQDDYEFTTATDFTIHNHILKLVLISNVEKNALDYAGRHKSTETIKSFKDEAALQQLVWLKSIENGGEEICPSVANLTVFTSIDQINKLFSEIEIRYRLAYGAYGRQLPPPNIVELRNLIHHLQRQFSIHNNPGTLGILTMPAVENSTTLTDFTRMNIFLHHLEATEKLTVQVLRLFLFIGVFHFDLHSSNALVVVDNGDISTRIIDFGRASCFYIDTPDYISVDNKILIRNHCDAIKADLQHLQQPTDRQKFDFIRGVLDYMLRLDTANNRAKYNTVRPQMGWLQVGLNNTHFGGNNNHLNLVRIFDALVATQINNPIGNPNGINAQKIQKYKTRGVLQDLESGSIFQIGQLRQSNPNDVDENMSYQSSNLSRVSSVNSSGFSRASSVNSSNINYDSDSGSGSGSGSNFSSPPASPGQAQSQSLSQSEEIISELESEADDASASASQDTRQLIQEINAMPDNVGPAASANSIFGYNTSNVGTFSAPNNVDDNADLDIFADFDSIGTFSASNNVNNSVNLDIFGRDSRIGTATAINVIPLYIFAPNVSNVSANDIETFLPSASIGSIAPNAFGSNRASANGESYHSSMWDLSAIPIGNNAPNPVGSNSASAISSLRPAVGSNSSNLEVEFPVRSNNVSSTSSNNVSSTRKNPGSLRVGKQRKEITNPISKKKNNGQGRYGGKRVTKKKRRCSK